MVVAPAVLLVKSLFDKPKFIERALGAAVDSADELVLGRFVSCDVIDDIIHRTS